MIVIDITYIITVLVIVLISMTIHEAMHGYVSYWLGDDTAEREGRLTLNPIAHIDPFLTIMLPLLLAISGGPIFGGAKPVPFNPGNVKYGEFGAMLVGVAGPLTNLLLAFLCFALAVFIPAASELFILASAVNIGFFVFNMIPIPPLDGSRVLYYLAPDAVRRAMAAMEVYGIVIVFAIVLLFGQYLQMYMRAATDFFLTAFASIFGTVI